MSGESEAVRSVIPADVLRNLDSEWQRRRRRVLRRNIAACPICEQIREACGGTTKGDDQ